jgi:hypothetical protein
MTSSESFFTNMTKYTPRGRCSRENTWHIFLKLYELRHFHSYCIKRSSGG